MHTWGRLGGVLDAINGCFVQSGETIGKLKGGLLKPSAMSNTACVAYTLRCISVFPLEVRSKMEVLSPWFDEASVTYKDTAEFLHLWHAVARPDVS